MLSDVAGAGYEAPHDAPGRPGRLLNQCRDRPLRLGIKGTFADSVLDVISQELGEWWRLTYQNTGASAPASSRRRYKTADAARNCRAPLRGRSGP